MIEKFKETLQVVYWYHYSNSLLNEDSGSHFIGCLYCAVMCSIFLFGLTNYMTAFGILYAIDYGKMTLLFGGFLGVYISKNVCVKDDGYLKGKAYFDSLPLERRKAAGFWINLTFMFYCSLPYITSLLFMVLVKFI